MHLTENFPVLTEQVVVEFYWRARQCTPWRLKQAQFIEELEKQNLAKLNFRVMSRMRACPSCFPSLIGLLELNRYKGGSSALVYSKK